MWFFDDDPGFEEGPPDDEPTDAEVFKDNRWPFGATGTAEDVPAPTGASCVQISNALSRAEGNAGEYSFGGLADTLPVVPGLFVDGVGPISVPLCEEQAEKLITRCDKSPFGRKMDTLMDENVRKSWQLHPGHVQLKNPLWQEGIDKLSETIADRLGYKNVKMQCVLYKMLVYGEGGHFAKHQDTEKKDGMIATMVIQLPTLHEGGDLVVYQGKDTKYRHDFGKMDGTAAYLPHYAVQYADAEHALEKVTSGYRLVLVYSVCLPSEMHFLLEDRDKPLTEELTEAISRMGDDGDSFALLLAHEYTKKSIEDMGIGALKGVDRARFQALQDANAGVTPEKKLHFVIAGLTLKIDYYDAGGEWEENERDESIAWYSTSGEDHGNSSEIEELNMLNPRRETLADLWKNRGNSTFEGYLGNEGATRDTTYSRFPG
ncbi:hypothetical protein PHYBOEH_009113 [Phytophthora boehmeriae]|uniref:Fe2OG dioxygenase domain-containing protein n=1 Tax=Phytophthora boehmeriae TaxID=109152 RepID=A0A8T1VVH1_9STRA|nr:hypothetical protein PHYBOEH_009113 [Phytophthora boehmeriae]